MTYFSAKIKFLTQLESGELKQVSEEYLLSAVSFIDAETKLAEHLDGMEYQLVALSMKTFEDIYKVAIETLGEKTFFKVVVKHVTIDPDTNREHKTKSNSLIEADSTNEAEKRIKEIWSNSVSDWEIMAIQVTNYKDVFI